MATTYYVSTIGNDGNAGTSTGSPFRTFSHAIPLLAAGDTLLARGGTYVENVTVNNSGSDWTTGAIHVEAYNNETVWIRPNGGANIILFNGVSYHDWLNIGLDGALLTPFIGAVPLYFIGNHLRWRGSSSTQKAIIKNSPWSGISGGGHSTYLEIIHVYSKDGGQDGGPGGAPHGLYFGGTNNIDAHILIQDYEASGHVLHSDASGLQIQSADLSDLASGITIDGAYLHDNSHGTNLTYTDSSLPGGGIVIKNSIISHNTNEGINLYSVNNGVQIYNNTIDRNGDWGILLGDGSFSTNALIKNNAITNNASGPIRIQTTSGSSKATIQFNDFNGNGHSDTVSDGNGLSTISNNITTAPGYTNESTGDFTLTSTSGLRDAGTTLSSVTTDYVGTARPQGAAYDIGAYEIGTTYYVSTTGNDSNSGTTTASPFRTITHAMSVWSVGNTIIVRGGVYDEALNVQGINGSAWTSGNYYTVKNYPGETVTLKPATSANNGGHWVMYFRDATSYIMFDGIGMDGANADDAVFFMEDRELIPLPHHIIYKNADCHGGTGPGGDNANFVFVGHDNQCFNCTVHGRQPGYGFYLHGHDNIVDSCDIYGTSSSGVQIYHNPSHENYAPPTNNIVRNCKIHDITESWFFGAPDTRYFGILVAGQSNLVYNNVMWNINPLNTAGPGQAGGMVIYTGDGHQFYNNTVAKSHVQAFVLGAVSNSVIDNNIAYGNDVDNIVDTGQGATGTSSTKNLFGINPNFVDYTNNNYHLTSASINCIDKGLTVSAVTSDIEGIIRPTGAAYDIGAYEFTTARGHKTFYVSTTGSNTNLGSSLDPFRTITYGLSQMLPGDTLLVRGGTYNELPQPTASGTDWTIGSGAIYVAAYPGETVWVKPNGGPNVVIFTGISYHIWERINLDGINTSDAGGSSLHIGNNSHHIRWTGTNTTTGRFEIKNCYWSGVTVDDSNPGPQYIQILKGIIHDGDKGGHGSAHGIYAGGTRNVAGNQLYQDLEIYNFKTPTTSANSGLQIQSYDVANYANGTIVDRCYLHDNEYGTFLTYSTGAGIIFTNNIVANNSATGVNLYSQASNTKVYNNTIHGNGDWGIMVGDGSGATGVLIKNNAITNNVSGPIRIRNTAGFTSATIQFNDFNGNGHSDTVLDENGLSTISNNITSVPSYQSVGTGDFRLANGSALIDTGTNLSPTVTTDHIQVARPFGVGYDIGAYENTSSSSPTPLTASGSSYAITGTAATISVATPSLHLTLTAGSGSVAMTGQIAGVRVALKFSAGSTSYTTTGSSIILKVGSPLTASPGSVAFTGTAASLSGSSLLSANAGTVVVTGTATTLIEKSRLVVDPTAYSVTGTDAGFLITYRMFTDNGLYTITGVGASLRGSTGVPADPGSVLTTGTDTNLILAIRFTADSGQVGITGTDATPRPNLIDAATPGSVTMTGIAASFVVNLTLPTVHLSVVGAPGTFNVSGKTVALSVKSPKHKPHSTHKLTFEEAVALGMPTSDRYINVVFAGLVGGTTRASAESNETSPVAITYTDLSLGDNIFTVPTGATAATFIFPSTNVDSDTTTAVDVVLKGNILDTGVTLHNTDPSSIGLDNSQVAIILTATASLTGVRIIWS